MSGFTYFNKRNPCPVCLSTKNCRVNSENLYFCKGDPGDGKGFKRTGESGLGWGLYVPDSQYRSRKDRDDTKEIYVPRPKPPKYKPLTPEQKDTAIRSVIAQLSLNPVDREDLLRRGLTDDQIKEIGFYSIEKGTRLKKPVHNLAGINKDGVTVRGWGCYGIPCTDVYGLKSPFQNRLRVPFNGGRYISNKSEAEGNRPEITIHNEFDEQPLQHVIKSDYQEGDDIDLVEGTLKPIIAGKRFDINCLGASGGNFAGSEQTLKRTIVDELKPGRVILNPDSGSLVNSLVLGSYRKLFYLLKSWGVDLWVRNWGQGFVKGKGDLDELDELPEEIKPYQNWDVCCEFPAIKELYAPNTADWLKNKIIYSHTAWVNNKKYTPHILIDVEKCPDIFIDKGDQNKSVEFPGDRQGLGLKLHTGQGKTTGIIRQVMSRYEGMGAIYLPSRNSLGEQFIKDCDNYIKANGLDKSMGFYMLNDVNGIKDYSYTSDPESRLVLCPDSLNKFKPEDFDGRVLILDEVESSERHLLGGETIGERQEEILKLFYELLKRCHCIIMADANLTDATVDYIQERSGIPITKVLNTRLPERPKVFFYDQVKNNTKLLLNQVLTEPFPWVMSDSQIECESITNYAFNKGRNFLRIDSETMNDKENKEQAKWINAFISDPNGTVENPDFPYDGIASSPTIESGLSSTSERFTGVYLFVKHLESMYSSQMIMRSRNIECPRHLAIVEYVSSREYDSTLMSPFENQLKKNLEESLKLGAGLTFDGDDGLECAEKAHRAIDAYVNSPEAKLYNKYKAIKNYERQNLKDCCLEVLVQSGFEIIMAETDGVGSPGYATTKKSVKEAKAIDVFNAPDITEEQYEILNRRSDLDKKERAKKEAYRLKQIMPGIDQQDDETESDWSVELIHHLKFKNSLVLKQAELRTLCSIPELARKKSQNGWYSLLNKDQKFLGNFKEQHPTVKVLVDLGVVGLLNELVEGGKYTKDTPEVLELYQRWTRELALKTKVDRGASGTTLIQRLATKLGYKVTADKRKNNERSYSISDLFTKDGHDKTIYHYVEMGLKRKLEKWENDDRIDGIKSQMSDTLDRKNAQRSDPPKTTEPMPDKEYGGDRFSLYNTIEKNLSPEQENHSGKEIIDVVAQPVSLVPAQIDEDDILDVLNDYLLEKRCDRAIKKNVSEGDQLLAEAINYASNILRLPAGEIRPVADDLAMRNKLIGIDAVREA